jgi:hydroxyacylglutathione hydrolase
LKLTTDLYMVGSGTFGLSHRFDCHVYLIDGGDGECALIDAGCGLKPENIMENFRQYGFPEHALKHLFITHSHLDHAGGALFFKEQTGCQIIGSKEAAKQLSEGSELELGVTMAKNAGIYPEDYSFPYCTVDVEVSDWDTVTVGKYEIQAITIRGHSTDSVCYLLTQGNYRVLFTGDAIFSGGAINPLNLPTSSIADYRADIGKLKNLAIDAFIPAHFTWTLRGGQAHPNKAIANLQDPSLPPVWREALSVSGYIV